VADFNLVLGQYDDPDNQEQLEYRVELYKKNVAIFGTTMSGKTTLLKTLIVNHHYTSAEKGGDNDKNLIYILDFSDNLQFYSTLPYVVAYFNGDNEENVRRLFKDIQLSLRANAKKLSELGGVNYFNASEKDRPPHITFIIDGLNTFFSQANYEKYHDTLTNLSRECLSKGVSIVFTAVDPVGSISRLLTYFKCVIAFDLPSEKYGLIYEATPDKPIVLQRRGVANLDNKIYEFQGFLPFNTINQDAEKSEIISLKVKLATKYKVKVKEWDNKRKKSFRRGEAVDENNWENFAGEPYNPEPGFLIPGMDYYSFTTPCVLDISIARSIAIYGRKSSGKTNVLWLILKAALSMLDAENPKYTSLRFVFWDDKRGGLNEIYNALDSHAHTGKFDKTVLQSQREVETFLLQEGYFGQNADASSAKSKQPEPTPQTKTDVASEQTMYSDEVDFATELNPPPYQPGIKGDVTCESYLSEGTLAVLKEIEEAEAIDAETAEANVDESLDPTPQAEHATLPTAVYDESQALVSVAENSDEAIEAALPALLEKIFTVFVVQNRTLYRSSPGMQNWRFAPILMSVVSTADEHDSLFVFADTQRITDGDTKNIFNSAIEHAFLTYDIFGFLNERGRGSVFDPQQGRGSQEVTELKEEFGPCEDVGDGFYYNLEMDELSKLKFIKILKEA